MYEEHPALPTPIWFGLATPQQASHIFPITFDLTLTVCEGKYLKAKQISKVKENQ